MKLKKGNAMQTNFYSTSQVGRILKLSPDLISKGIWQNRVKPPVKSPSGNYLWSIANIESAAWALKRYAEFNQWQVGAIKSCNKPGSNNQ
jgi:hypothetical protein